MSLEALFSEETDLRLISSAVSITSNPVANCTELAPVGIKLQIAANDIMQVPASYRRLALEKLNFCKLVNELQRGRNMTEIEAVELVATRRQSEFPELLTKGKGGKSALRHSNYRHWLKLLGRKRDGSVNFDNANALCDSYARGDRGVYGDPMFWQLYHAFYLNRNQLSAAEAYRLAAAKIKKENPFAIIPSAQQAAYNLNKLDPAAVMLARHGEEALKNNLIDFIRRDWDCIAPADMYVADHRQFDAPIKIWDEKEQKWKATRPWICAMIDARSWYVTGWIIQDESPNSATIQDTLALTILGNNMIPPAYMYSDNGADFIASGLSTEVEFDGHKHSIYRELGIQTITSIAYNAKAKTVERLFRDVAISFDKYFAAYLGNKPSARPDVAGFFYDNPDYLPTLEQFCQLWRGWLDTYHKTPKNGKIHEGKSPLEIWESRKCTRAAWDPERLAYAMLRPEKELRKVRRGPCIQIDRMEYFSDALWPHLDKKVMVKRDTHDDKHIYAFTTAGELICECRTRRRISALATDAEERAEIGRQLANTRAQIKRAYTYINELTGKDHLVSPMELFLSKGVDLKIEKAGARSSVKGATHNFKHYVPAAALPADEPAPQLPENIECEAIETLSAREEKEIKIKAELSKIEAIVTKKSDDEVSSKEDLARFYAQTIIKKNDDDEI